MSRSVDKSRIASRVYVFAGYTYVEVKKFAKTSKNLSIIDIIKSCLNFTTGSRTGPSLPVDPCKVPFICFLHAASSWHHCCIAAACM